jgi:glutathione S-transferase
MSAGERKIERDVFYRFFASDVSYFSGKVRPALRYKRVPFVEILATRRTYREVIVPRTGLAFIPVVVTDRDETLQDTSDILDFLEARFPDPPLYPATPVQRMVAYLWELSADEFLILPGLHYRWSFPESEAKARADFAATTGDVDRADRFADTIKAFTGPIGVRPETAPAIEAHTRELLDRFSEHLARHAYLLGDRPSLADDALMGSLYPHLYLDAVPGRLLRETAPRVCHWIDRMNHPEPGSFGDWLDGDTLAPTMRPMLESIGRDAVPLILDTVRAFEEWADSRPADLEEPPRGVGVHRTRLRGVEFDRFTSSYTLWMVQRPLDQFRRLSPGEQRAVLRVLEGTGCEALFTYAPRHRLGKRHFKLVFEG